MSHMQQSSKPSASSIPPSIITVIQYYLHGNFVYTRLALCSKKIREVLNTCGLRKFRELKLYTPQAEQRLNPQTVLEMLNFSDQIFIKIEKNANFESLKSNLDLLCHHLLLAMYNLEYKAIFQQSKFTLWINDQNLTIPFSIQNLSQMEKSEEITEGKLDNFFKFFNHIKAPNTLYLNNINFSRQKLQNNSYLSELQHIQKSTNYQYLVSDSIFKQMRQCLKRICFQDCNFYGTCTANFSIIYPMIEKLTFRRMRFNANGEYGKYLNLKYIFFMDCETYELVVNTYKTYEYRKINNGVTLDIIFKFFNNQQLNAQPIHALQADIFFNESLKRNYPLSLLTSINHCVLRDAWTIYSFTIIHTLLTSTKDIKKAQSLLPIILNVSNFNDSYQIPNNAKIMDTLSHLRELAKYRGLQATLMSIVNSNNKQICKMQLQLQGNQGRKLNLTINKSLMVMINENEEVKIETQ